MTEIEDVMLCSKCKKYTVYYIWDSRRKTIEFYPEPHLKEAEVKHATLQMKKTPNKEDSTKYDVVLHCPVCSGVVGPYCGVPLDWECLDTPGALALIPIEDLKPWIVRVDLNQKEGATP